MKVFRTGVQNEPFAKRLLASDRRRRRKASSPTDRDVVGREVAVARQSTADLVTDTDTQTTGQNRPRCQFQNF